jgi:multidrug efflux system membrane fusion protein
MRFSSKALRGARWAAGRLVLLTAVAMGGCAKPKPPPRPPVPVTVGVVERGPVPDLIVANGQVEPINSVTIQPQVGGVLGEVLFREGAEVSAGELLFKIDSRPYVSALRQAEAMLARDQAQADNAQRDAERYAALVQKDYVTKSQADQAAAAAAAQKAVVEADRAAVETARLNVEYASIRAPIAGKSGSLLVRAGNVVRPGGGDPLVTINQVRPIRVRFAVPERDLAEVQRYAKGGKVRVSATPAGEGAPEQGLLSFLENAVDTITGTVTLKAEFPNPSGRLWPGQFVAVQVELYVEPNALTVPSQAILVGQSGSYVFVVEPGDTVRVQPVTTGRSVRDRTVIEKGVDAGTRVVTDGQSRLEAGSAVEVRSGAK